MPCLLKEHWIVMLRPKMLMTASNKVDLGLRECATLATFVESLKKRLVKAWSKIDQKIFHAAVDEFPCRFKAVINSKGNHFE